MNVTLRPEESTRDGGGGGASRWAASVAVADGRDRIDRGWMSAEGGSRGEDRCRDGCLVELVLVWRLNLCLCCPLGRNLLQARWERYDEMKRVDQDARRTLSCL